MRVQKHCMENFRLFENIRKNRYCSKTFVWSNVKGVISFRYTEKFLKNKESTSCG